MPRLASKTKPAADTPLEGLDEFAQPATEPEQPVEDNVKPIKAAGKKATKPAATAAEPDQFGFYQLDDADEFLNVLLYGREGTTKTTSACYLANIPGARRVLVINAEGGLKKTALQRRGVDTSKIVGWPAPGVRITFRSLEALHEKLAGDLADDPLSWTGVIVDSTTEIHQALRSQATDKRIQKALRNPQVVDKTLIDEDFVDRDDYGVMTNQLRDIIRDLRDLPCHVVLTALQRDDEKTGITGPALTPALANDVLGYVDLTLAMRASVHAEGEDEDQPIAEFRALTRPGKATRAKDRFDLTPRVLAEPRFDRILGYIRGELEEASDPIQAAYVARREAEAAAKAADEAAKEDSKPSAKRRATKTTGAKAATGGEESTNA